MAKIKLDDKFFIQYDGVGYTLFRDDGKFNPKDNKPYLTTICYPSTIEAAVQRYLRDCNIDFEGTLLEYINTLHKSIDKLNLNSDLEVKLREVKNG